MKNFNEHEKPRTRLLYLDYFRGIIIFLMIQGHLFRALLQNELKTGSWFNIHEFIHGVVAPGFLFLSGYLFYYTVRKKTSFEIVKKMRYYIGVVLIGYFLHLPFLSLRKILALWGRGVESKLLYMDILQTIGYSLILSALILILLKRFFIPLISLLFIFNLFQCYFSIGTDNIFFSFFFNQDISQFPLFPWSLYFFAGILISRFVKKFNYPLIIFSLLLLFFASSFSGNFSKLISDLGKLLFFYSFFLLIPDFNSKIIENFLISSRESMFLYVSHMMIIYGSVLNRGIVFFSGDKTGFLTVSLVFMILIIILYPAAYFLNRFKNSNFRIYNILKYGSYSVIFLIFIIRKY